MKWRYPCSIPVTRMVFHMKHFVLATIATGLLPLSVAGADTDPGCNQLGREVALRAAEQMQTALDAAARSELAAIAETVCREFTVPMATPPAVSGEAEAPAAQPPAEREGLFDLQLIPPEDRVRRPGLKRL